VEQGLRAHSEFLEKRVCLMENAAVAGSGHQ
jgi:hypothetical protein